MDRRTFVTEDKLIEAINVLKKVAEGSKSTINNKKPLFEEDRNFVFLQFLLKKVPLNYSTYIHYIDLPYHWRHEMNYETCFIVKDLNEKPLPDRDADIEQTRDHYTQILKEHSVIGPISKILPMRQLINEFRLPALRKKLSSQYNVFLCDRKLLRNKYSFLSRFLGKAFWIDNKKVPIMINLEETDLKSQINKKLNQTSLYVSGKGSTLTICFGYLKQETNNLAKNLTKVLEKIHELYGNNVRELAIKTERSMAILFYMDLGSANEITLEKTNEESDFVEEEFDFLSNSNVRVYKDGHIRVVKRPNTDDVEENGNNEAELIDYINNEPDEECWNRRMIFNNDFSTFKKQKLLWKKPGSRKTNLKNKNKKN